MRKEKAFFDALRDVFVGAKVEGESGFVNLMRIKSRYYELGVFPRLKEDIDEALKPFPEFREELFDRLYTFFRRYFSECGWLDNSGAFLRFYEYPPELWGYFRSTNLMERFIREVRRGTKVRDHKFPSEAAVYKLLSLESESQETRLGERRLKGFGEAREVLEKKLVERYGPFTHRLTQNS